MVIGFRRNQLDPWNRIKKKKLDPWNKQLARTPFVKTFYIIDFLLSFCVSIRWVINTASKFEKEFGTINLGNLYEALFFSLSMGLYGGLVKWSKF